jgi:hypothetical protein
MTDDERNRRRAIVLVRRISARLPAMPRDWFLRAIEDKDEDKAWRAIDMAPPDCIPDITVCYYLMGFPAATIQAAFMHAIRGAQAQLKLACHREGDCFWPLLRAARFPIPADLPQSFTVWRGTYGVSKDTASAGDWWTDSRDIAIFYATQVPRPLVIRRLVPKTAILFATETYCGLNLLTSANSNGASYDSALHGMEFIFDLPPGGFTTVHGCEDEWVVRGQRLREDIRARLADALEAAETD